MRIALIKIYMAFVLLTMVFISGCVSSSGSFAGLIHDDTVKQSFENYEVNEAYHYYYYGPVSLPMTVIGVSKDFEMASDLWKPIDLTPKQLESWIFGHTRRKALSKRQYGSNIIGPDGEFIGVWYSFQDWQQWARIELVDKNTITISRPTNSSLYDRKREGL